MTTVHIPALRPSDVARVCSLIPSSVNRWAVETRMPHVRGILLASANLEDI